MQAFAGRGNSLGKALSTPPPTRCAWSQFREARATLTMMGVIQAAILRLAPFARPMIGRLGSSNATSYDVDAVRGHSPLSGTFAVPCLQTVGVTERRSRSN